MLTTKRVYVLVKAYPQPSVQYQETVCCAGITEAGEFVRLFPIRYRRLKPEQRFERYDLIEVRGDRPRQDSRPESFHVDESSIKILRSGTGTRADTKHKIWLPYVSRSLDALHDANERGKGVSLGIVKPDPDSIKFGWEPHAKLGAGEREISKALHLQTSLIEDPLKALPAPEFAFTYRYKSAGRKSEGKIHDWEVQAAYAAYKRQYGNQALEKLRDQYERVMAAQHLHLFLGTMQQHPAQFIIVGLLRTGADVDAIDSQDLFGVTPR